MKTEDFDGLFYHKYPVILLSGISGKPNDRVIVHELSHCWHVYGCSLGTLFNWFSNNMKNHIIWYLEKTEHEYRKGILTAKVPIFTDPNAHARGWFLFFKLLHLFTYGVFHPKNSMDLLPCQFNRDYIEAFCHFIEYTESEWEIEEWFDDYSLIKKNYKEFIWSLARTGDKSINAMHSIFKRFQNNSHPRFSANILTTNDLIEDYARLFDTIYNYGGIETDEFEKICNDILSAKNYGESFRWFKKHTFREIKDAHLNLIVDYILVLETSLMTPFHPYVFFGKPYELLELHPPIRFCTMVQHWHEILYSFSITSDSLINSSKIVKDASLSWVNQDIFSTMADDICNMFCWTPYTEILNKIKGFSEDYYDTSMPEEKYIKSISDYIVNSKLAHKIIDYELLKSLPVKRLSEINPLENIPKNSSKIFEHFICDWVHEPFSCDLILNNDYLQTEYSIKTLEKFISRESINRFLGTDEINIKGFMDSNIHKDPFVKKKDMVANFNGKRFR